jgi:hypothetical protein
VSGFDITGHVGTVLYSDLEDWHRRSTTAWTCSHPTEDGLQTTSLVRIGMIIAVAANLLAVVQFGNQFPWTYALLALAVVAALLAPLSDRFLTYWKLRAVLSRAEQLISEQGIRPECLIAFDRSSAIYAGMLCQRLAIGEMLVLPRRAIASSIETAPRSIVVGDGVEVQYSEERLAKSLVLVFHLRTGATFEAGIRVLTPPGKQFPGRVLAIYATDGAIARWPRVLCVKRIPPGYVPNDKLPWLSGPYVHK